jgi:hypothetical protein
MQPPFDHRSNANSNKKTIATPPSNRSATVAGSNSIDATVNSFVGAYSTASSTPVNPPIVMDPFGHSQQHFPPAAASSSSLPAVSYFQPSSTAVSSTQSKTAMTRAISVNQLHYQQQQQHQLQQQQQQQRSVNMLHQPHSLFPTIPFQPPPAIPPQHVATLPSGIMQQGYYHPGMNMIDISYQQLQQQQQHQQQQQQQQQMYPGGVSSFSSRLVLPSHGPYASGYPYLSSHNPAGMNPMTGINPGTMTMIVPMNLQTSVRNHQVSTDDSSNGDKNRERKQVTKRNVISEPAVSAKRERRIEPSKSSSSAVGQSLAGQTLSDGATILTKPRKQPRPRFGLGGQRRLHITFQDLGRSTDPPQTFGNYGQAIPDGLCGTHTMYSQDWKFLITHGIDVVTSKTVLTWQIINLSSGQITSMTETPHQASLRQTKGKTICNLVMQKALKDRATELEESLNQAGNRTAIQVSNILGLIKKLRPTQCTEGLLFFGLRHDIVQQAHGAALDAEEEVDAIDGNEVDDHALDVAHEEGSAPTQSATDQEPT